ncbi:MAG: poly(3-hydroxybutyrate) depolymerase [Acidimicrobiales bacterium]|nr:poly(3-hydroxybutyrate) depolymerase [Acidimicrobiales bacterium]
MSMERSSRRAASALLVGVTLLVAGCSGSSAKPAASTAAPSSTPASADASTTTRGASSTASTAAPVPSAGCGSSQVGALHEQRRTVQVQGTERWYLLTAPKPASGTRPRPLVVDLHGLSEGAQAHTQMSKFGDLGERQGFVVAVPHGSGTIPSWKSSGTGPNSDVDFVAKLLDTVQADLCIDTSRVYATGLSNGALMSSLLACRLPQRFAAIAPVAGVIMPDGCPATATMPVLAFHGTQDPILKFNGGIGDLSGALSGKSGPPTTVKVDLHGAGYPAAVVAWAKRDGCAPTPHDQQLTAAVIHRRFDCPKGTAVEMFIVIGGGHAWPGSQFSRNIAKIVGPTTFDIDATKEAWKFFQRFTRRAS